MTERCCRIPRLIDQWDAEGDHEKVIGVIESLPQVKRGYHTQLRLARSLIAVGRHGYALTVLTEQHGRGNDDPLWHRMMGSALSGMSRWEEAEEHLLRAISLDSDDPETWRLLAAVYRDGISDQEGLEKCLQRLTELESREKP